MTDYTYVVDAEVTAAQILGDNESLLVTTAGSIMVAPGSAVYAITAAENATIDILGTVDGGSILQTLGGTKLHVGAGASIVGGLGLMLGHMSPNFVTNDGMISGSISVSSGAALTLINSGVINSQTGAMGLLGGLQGSDDADTIINEGIIRGGKIELGGGNDIYFGRSGFAQAFIFLDEGDDVAYGGAGSEYFFGGAGDDRIDGGAGQDTALFGDPLVIDRTIDLRITGPQDTGSGFDTLINIENLCVLGSNNKLIGNDAANVLVTADGQDTLIGGNGNDVLFSEFGDDVFDGGAGIDTVTFTAPYGSTDFFSVLVGVRVILSITGKQDTKVGRSTFIGIENLVGTAFPDSFIGNAVANNLVGNAGDDTLSGGYGNDILSGGGGKDTFILKEKLSKTGNVDKITDYNKVDDTIMLDNAYMTKLGSNGALSSSKFVLGTKAKDSNDYLIYDKAAGKLYYDADGSGKAAQVLIAQFTNKAALAASEFIII